MHWSHFKSHLLYRLVTHFIFHLPTRVIESALWSFAAANDWKTHLFFFWNQKCPLFMKKAISGMLSVFVLTFATYHSDSSVFGQLTTGLVYYLSNLFWLKVKQSIRRYMWKMNCPLNKQHLQELLTFTSARLYLLQMTGSLVISSIQTPLQTTWDRVEDAMHQRLLNYTHCFTGFAAGTAAQNNRRCDLMPREHHAAWEIKFTLKFIIASDLAANLAVFRSAFGSQFIGAASD